LKFRFGHESENKQRLDFTSPLHSLAHFWALLQEISNFSPLNFFFGVLMVDTVKWPGL